MAAGWRRRLRCAGGHLNSKGRRRRQKAAFQDGWSNRPVAVAREGGTATQILIFLWMAGMRVRATEFEMESQAEGGFYLRPQQRVNTFRMSCRVRFSLMTLSSIDSVVKGCVSHCGKSLVLCELVHFTWVPFKSTTRDNYRSHSCVCLTACVGGVPRSVMSSKRDLGYYYPVALKDLYVRNHRVVKL